MESQSEQKPRFILPKMVKYVNDPCYGLSFNPCLDACLICWLKKSCENNTKALIKKQKMANNPKKKPPEKSYKKTDKYREWR
jgi:hypothetical protein